MLTLFVTRLQLLADEVDALLRLVDGSAVMEVRVCRLCMQQQQQQELQMETRPLCTPCSTWSLSTLSVSSSCLRPQRRGDGRCEMAAAACRSEQ